MPKPQDLSISPQVDRHADKQTERSRMYKTRFKEWGLGKNFQAGHVLSLLHSQQQRSLENKPSEFFIRGVKVDSRKLRAYLKRKPDLVERFKKGACPTVIAAGEVASRTPSPSPPPPETIPAALPRSGTVQKALLEGLTGYIDGIWPTDVWEAGFLDCPSTSVRPTNYLESLRFLWDRLVLPNEGFAAYETIQLRTLFDLVNSPLPGVLLNEPPMLLSWALGLMAFFNHAACQSLLQEFMACLVHLTQRSLGEKHRLEAIWLMAYETLQKRNSEALDKVYNCAMVMVTRSRKVGEGLVIEGVKELHHLWKPGGGRSYTLPGRGRLPASPAVAFG